MEDKNESNWSWSYLCNHACHLRMKFFVGASSHAGRLRPLPRRVPPRPRTRARGVRRRLAGPGSLAAGPVRRPQVRARRLPVVPGSPSTSCAARRGCSPRSRTRTSCRSTPGGSRPATTPPASCCNTSRAARSARRVEQHGPLRWDIATRYVTDIAEGLAAMHARGVVHRDVKPDNLLYDPENDEALLTDLGVAARLTDPASQGGHAVLHRPRGLRRRHLGPRWTSTASPPPCSGSSPADTPSTATRGRTCVGPSRPACPPSTRASPGCPPRSSGTSAPASASRDGPPSTPSPATCGRRSTS